MAVSDTEKMGLSLPATLWGAQPCVQVSDPEVDGTQPAVGSQGDLRKRTKQQELRDRKQELRLDGVNTLVSVPLAMQHIEGTAHFGTLDTLVSSGQCW